MEAISQEISEIDGRSPESVYELLRTIFHTGKVLTLSRDNAVFYTNNILARPGWHLPEWRQGAPIPIRRVSRLRAIETSLDDTTNMSNYEGGFRSEQATELWQRSFQRYKETRKRHNKRIRANYNGLDIDARNAKIEWHRNYRRRHGEERNRKRREIRARERAQGRKMRKACLGDRIPNQ